jgi:hypothetical protein
MDSRASQCGIGCWWPTVSAEGERKGSGTYSRLTAGTIEAGELFEPRARPRASAMFRPDSYLLKSRPHPLSCVTQWGETSGVHQAQGRAACHVLAKLWVSPVVLVLVWFGPSISIFVLARVGHEKGGFVVCRCPPSICERSRQVARGLPFRRLRAATHSTRRQQPPTP